MYRKVPRVRIPLSPPFTFWKRPLSIFFNDLQKPNPAASVALPVHDAIAVKQCDAEWAKEAIERVWYDKTLGGKT